MQIDPFVSFLARTLIWKPVLPDGLNLTLALEQTEAAATHAVGTYVCFFVVFGRVNWVIMTFVHLFDVLVVYSVCPSTSSHF